MPGADGIRPSFPGAAAINALNAAAAAQGGFGPRPTPPTSSSSHDFPLMGSPLAAAGLPFGGERAPLFGLAAAAAGHHQTHPLLSNPAALAGLDQQSLDFY